MASEGPLAASWRMHQVGPLLDQATILSADATENTQAVL